MLPKKKQRLLELLEDQIAECNKCSLYYSGGGMSLPYWTPLSRFVMIAEAPGREEVGHEPLVGSAGRHLWEIMDQFGLRKELFGIINSVQCRPLTSTGSNDNPTKKQCGRCYPWIRKFIKIINPEKALILGNYAKSQIIGGEPMGIMSRIGEYTVNSSFGRDIFFYFSVHPSVCIYKGEEGKRLLSRGIEAFDREAF